MPGLLTACHFDGAWGVFAAEAAGLRLEAQTGGRLFPAAGLQALVLPRRPAGPRRRDRPPGRRRPRRLRRRPPCPGCGLRGPGMDQPGPAGNPQRHRALRRRSGRAAGRRRLVLPPAGLRLGRHGRGRLLAGRRRGGGPRLQGIPDRGRPTAAENRTSSRSPTLARSTAPSPP